MRACGVRPADGGLGTAGVAAAALLAGAACARSDAEGSLPAVSAAADGPRSVSALGRLEPEDGIRRLAGPSGPAAVIAELHVDKGGRVEPGQIVAVLDTVPIWQASILRLQAELANARNELRRQNELNTNAVVSRWRWRSSPRAPGPRPDDGVPMPSALGWMQLKHQKLRLLVATSGIAFAVVLILM